jgi:hypothetical protein
MTADYDADPGVTTSVVLLAVKHGESFAPERKRIPMRGAHPRSGTPGR